MQVVTGARRSEHVDGRGTLLRVSTHATEGTVVVSLWRHSRCIGTFRAEPEQVDAIVAALCEAAASAASPVGPGSAAVVTPGTEAVAFGPIALQDVVDASADRRPGSFADTRVLIDPGSGSDALGTTRLLRDANGTSDVAGSDTAVVYPSVYDADVKDITRVLVDPGTAVDDEMTDPRALADTGTVGAADRDGSHVPTDPGAVASEPH